MDQAHRTTCWFPNTTCIRVFDNTVPSAKNVQPTPSLLDEVLPALHGILSVMWIYLIRWSWAVLPLNLIIIFYLFLSRIFLFLKFCLTFYLFVPFTCLVLQWSVSCLRAGALYLQEHIAQQCMWEWVLRIGLLTSINCNGLFCKSDLRCLKSFFFFSHGDTFERDPLFFTVVCTRCSQWNLEDLPLD